MFFVAGFIVDVVGINGSGEGGGARRHAVNFDEAAKDVVDGTAMDVEGGAGHEGGSEQSGHHEVQRKLKQH